MYVVFIKVTVIIFRFEPNFNDLNRFSQNTTVSYYITSRSVGAEFFHVERRKDGRTDNMTKPIVAFRNSANAYKYSA
jgi:hypothetical protein